MLVGVEVTLGRKTACLFKHDIRLTLAKMSLQTTHH
jgi:hypothetical protein